MVMNRPPDATAEYNIGIGIDPGVVTIVIELRSNVLELPLTPEDARDVANSILEGAARAEEMAQHRAISVVPATGIGTG
jgi:hypothetical protein